MKLNSFVLLRIIYTLIIASAGRPHLHSVSGKTCCTQIRKYYVPFKPASLRLLMLLANTPTDNYLITEPDTKLAIPTNPSPTSPPASHSAIDDHIAEKEKNKAKLCSQLTCPPEFQLGPVCACNFNTGNVVSFKNKCDLKKHNCRFDTAFKVILEEICPWEYESRRADSSQNNEYDDSKYHNA